MLYGNTASQRNHTLNVLIADRFRVIEEPMYSLEGNIAIYFFEYIEEAFDRFVIGCMQAERPFGRSEMPNDRIHPSKATLFTELIAC